VTRGVLRGCLARGGGKATPSSPIDGVGPLILREPTFRVRERTLKFKKKKQLWGGAIRDRGLSN